jgi:single-strand DNA-binding protein
MIALQAFGTLGKDAEVKDINGKKVINFSVAVNQGYGDNKTTLWIDCAKWGEKTGIAEYLKKGTKVALSGEPSLRKWEGGATITLRVNDITLGGSSNGEQAAPVANEAMPQSYPVREISNAELDAQLPF